MWCFINSGIVWEFDASHHAVVVLLGLRAILVLPLARMPVLKLYWQRATSVLKSRVCYLVHLGPHLCSKRQLRKNHNFGTATGVIMRLQQRWSCEVVGSDQFSQGDPGLCWGSSSFQIVDVTLHDHWHICQVRRQPSCCGSFAWLGSHSSLATGKDATVEVVLATCRKCSSKSCLLFGPFGPTSLQQKAAA